MANEQQSQAGFHFAWPGLTPARLILRCSGADTQAHSFALSSLLLASIVQRSQFLLLS